MVRRVGGPGDVPRMRNESAWKQSWGLAWKFLLYEHLLHHVGITANLADKDVTHCAEMFPEWLWIALHSQLLYTPLHSERNKDHENKLHTTLSLLHYAEDVGEVHVGCLEPISNNSVYSHNEMHCSEPQLTLVMCSLCCYCFSPHPRIHCKTVVGLPCPVH